MFKNLLTPSLLYHQIGRLRDQSTSASALYDLRNDSGIAASTRASA